MARAGETHHLRLTTSAGGSEAGLVLQRREDGSLEYARTIGPPQKIQQRSYHKGLGKITFDPADSYRYFQSDGCDARFEDAVQPANSLTRTDFVLRNGRFESWVSATEATGWTASGGGGGGSWDREGTIVDEGSFSGKLTRPAGAPSLAYRQALVNPTFYRGVLVTVYARMRQNAANKGQIQIGDDAGNNTSTLSSTVDAFVSLTASRTIDATATFVNIDLNLAGDTAVCYWDNVFITISGVGGLLDPLRTTFQEFAGSMYMGLSGGIYQYNVANEVWNAVLLDNTVAFTDLSSYDGALYAARGASNSYKYSTNGTTWTTSTLVDPGDKATYFERTTNSAGAHALAKAILARSVYFSTNPQNGGSWSAAYTVGDSDRDITALYGAFDTLYVGREDGLWEYFRYFADGTAADEFKNLTEHFNKFPNANHFARGLYFKGWLYLSLGATGLVRFRPEGAGAFEELSNLLSPAGSSDFGNKVNAFGTDGNFLYILADKPVSNTSNDKVSWLLALWERDGKPEVHTLASFASAILGGLYAFNNVLHIAERVRHGNLAQDVAAIWRMDLPQKHINPRLDVDISLATSGTIITPYYEFPEIVRLIGLKLFSENLSANVSVTVAYQKDNETSFTNINSTDAAFNTSPSEVILFSTQVNARRVRLRLTLATNDGTASGSIPVVTSWELYFRKLFQWNFTAIVDEENSVTFYECRWLRP